MGEVINLEGVEKKSIGDFAESAYLDYAMYVVLDRALPHIGDGLKPVQRRIIYSMSELRLSNDAKFKKSARTVGDVLGKYHPHSDVACYEAMVNMAQDFNARYPMVDGQGNWGSPDDPKSFAAMRYTESRLSKYANLLLDEIKLGVVDWEFNFDGTLKEPKVLPSQLPNVLLNGATGIAVGMSTDIPPHNLTEIAEACVHMVDNPKATVKDLMQFIKGPDFPTNAEIITPKADIANIYKTGNGSLKLRAVYHKEGKNIVVTDLPYMVSGAKLLEQIAAQMQAKKLPLVADLRDESDHENPTRLVIVPKSSKTDLDSLMSHLFASTDLEKNYRVNLNIIGLNNRPAVKSLPQIISEWLEFRENLVKLRLETRLEKVLARLHILDGLLIAFLNIDEVIRIIRKEDKPKEKLMKKFKLSAEQAEAILELKLRHLAKLEETKIKGEQKELAKERDTLEQTLGSTRKLKTLMKKELKATAEKYGDARKSKLKKREEAQLISLTKLQPAEDVTIVLSEKGWIRVGKGHEIDPTALSYKAGDKFLYAVPSNTQQSAIIIDKLGRSYTIPVKNLPSARGYGDPATTHVTTAGPAEFTTLLSSSGKENYLALSDQGYGFAVPKEELMTKNKKGKQIVTISGDVRLLPLTEYTEDCIVVMASTDGRMLAVTADEVPELVKGKGKKLFNIQKTEFAEGIRVVAAVCIKKKGTVTVVSNKRKKSISWKDLEHYIGQAGQRGRKLPKGLQKISDLLVD